MGQVCVAFHPVAPVQVVSVFSSFGFQWPVQLTKLFAASSMSTFNEQLMAPECSIGAWSFELKCVPSLQPARLLLRLSAGARDGRWHLSVYVCVCVRAFVCVGVCC
jgi:hypothetical protein